MEGKPLSNTLARSPIFTFNSSNSSVVTKRTSAQSFNRSSFVVCDDVMVNLKKTGLNDQGFVGVDCWAKITESRIFLSKKPGRNASFRDDSTVLADAPWDHCHLWYGTLPCLKPRRSSFDCKYSVSPVNHIPRCLTAGISKRWSARTSASSFCAKRTPCTKRTIQTNDGERGLGNT